MDFTRTAAVPGLLALILAGFPAPLPAQQVDAQQLIEDARARARRIEEAKTALGDADPIVRLAAFDAMVSSGDPLFRDVAIDTGLGGSDHALRARALVYAVLARKQLLFELTADSTAAREVLEKSREHVASNGPTLRRTVDSRKSDVDQGVVALNGGNAIVHDLIVTLNLDNGAIVGELGLQNDNTLKGTIRFKHFKTTVAQFNASGALR